MLADAFFNHLKRNNLDERIEEIAHGMDYENFQDLEQKTEKIRTLIEGADTPHEIEEEIIDRCQGKLDILFSGDDGHLLLSAWRADNRGERQEVLGFRLVGARRLYS